MRTVPSATTALTLVVCCAFLMAGAALYLTLGTGDPLKSVFRQVLTIYVIVGLVVWFAAAWLARGLIVGRLPKLQMSATVLIWSGFRIALLIAVVLLLICWLGALALQLPLEVAFVRAAVLLMVVAAFTGMTGGAFLNSTFALRHLRSETS
jgi:hypothetical protein